jgi:7-carboxy-7-deazaguanine synthase (Cx14CxxC type)
MTYSVKEIYYTLQGEGAQTGRPSVFLRFTGCNLWSGREKDRAAAVCNFCDTDFVGTDGHDGGKYVTARDLVAAVSAAWPGASAADATPFVVCTGGEPLLQLDDALIAALHSAGFEIAVETNGTIAAPGGIDWLCVSPKGTARVVQDSGNELKLVYPQPEPEARPERFVHMDFERFSLQPLDSPARDEHTRAAIRYCLSHPRWSLSLQTHKLIGIP